MNIENFHLDSVVDSFARDGWAVCDGFLAPHIVAQLATEAQAGFQAGDFHAARVGQGQTRAVVTEIRRDRICWLEPEVLSVAQQQYWDLLDLVRLEFNRSLFLGLFDYEAHFAIFPPNAYYKRHLDQFQASGLRTVSCILYLTDAWTESDGGALRLYLPEGHCDIYPQAGRLVCFLSARFFHEVRPASRERLSITGWFSKRSELPVTVG